MRSRNKLKIGLFAANCSSGRTPTSAPDRWRATWPECVLLAQQADDAGLEFMLPIGRWKGYGGETDFQGATFETINWASGLLAKTRRITVFGTVHAPLIHPVVAAKAFVTADHIGEGRFGLNVVVGWNEDEFDMFGVTQRDHEARYRYGQEWLEAIKLMWERDEDFDFDGEFLELKGLRAKPKPYGGVRPIIMNAGKSPAGRAFALRNCDAYFTGVKLTAVADAAEEVAEVKASARADGREVGVFTVGDVVCRRTREEAQAYYRYWSEEHVDWGAIDAMLRFKGITPASEGPERYETIRRDFVHGFVGFPMIGTPDDVAGLLTQIGGAGFDGIAVSFVNYLDDFPYFRAEVLPRLERAGLRVAS